MDLLHFAVPCEEHEAALADYVNEHRAAGETHLHGSSMLTECGSCAEWLAQLRRNADPTAARAAGWVQATTLLCFRRPDGRLVGMLDIRHTLNDFLQNYGGNIGYGVRPSERGKGYAGAMLRFALRFCAGLGMERAMAACEKQNAASAATIRSCGGVLEREFLHTDGSEVQVYQLNTGESPIGLARGTVRLLPHDDVWDALAASAANTLRQIFGRDALDVQHVGSTAVPDLRAKPILDLAVGVPALSAAPAHFEALAAAGFLHVPQNDESWEYFCSAGDRARNLRTHHVHIVVHGAPRWNDYLAFRDALRADRALRARYEAKKLQLADAYPNDRVAYTSEKAPFILDVLRA